MTRVKKFYYKALSDFIKPSSASYVPQNVQSSFPEADLEHVVSAQLAEAGSDLIDAEYLQWSHLAV